MSVATEILSLRQNRSSSVETLLAAIEWEKAAQEEEHILSRRYAVREAADIVLLNVAVHAAEALSEPPVIRRTRRGLLSCWRKPRRSNPGSCISVGCSPSENLSRALFHVVARSNGIAKSVTEEKASLRYPTKGS